MIRLSPIVKHLILLNVVVFVVLNLSIYQNLDGLLEYLDKIFILRKSDLLGFRGYPPNADTGFLPVQIVGWFFAHVDLFHILFNMLALASIGPVIESVLGGKRFFRFYLFCGLFGGLLVTFLDPSNTPVLGASGAISGVLTAFAIIFPTQKLSFFFLPPIESRYLVGGVAVISVILVALEAFGQNVGGGISHFGHLSGMIAAVIFLYIERLLLDSKNKR